MSILNSTKRHLVNIVIDSVRSDLRHKPEEFDSPRLPTITDWLRSHSEWYSQQIKLGTIARGLIRLPKCLLSRLSKKLRNGVPGSVATGVITLPTPCWRLATVAYQLLILQISCSIRVQKNLEKHTRRANLP